MSDTSPDQSPSPSAAAQSAGEGEELAQLGTGSQSDQLSFRLVLRLLARCVRLLRPVRPHLYGLFFGFGSLALIFVPIGAWLMDAFWTRVLQGEALTQAQATFLALDPAVFAAEIPLDPDQRRAVLRRVVVWSFGIALIATPIGMSLYYYQVWILQKINQVLRLEMLDRLQSLSMRFHSDSSVGDAIYRTYQDSAMVTQLIDVLVLTPVQTLSRLAFALGVLAFFSPLLALALLLAMPPMLWVGYHYSRPLRISFRAAREANAALTARIQETLSGIRVIKAYGAEKAEQALFEQDSQRAFQHAYHARGTLLGLFFVVLFWVAMTALVLASALVAIWTIDEAPVWAPALGFTAFTLGLYNYAKVRFTDGVGNMRGLLRTWGRTQDVAIGLDRVFELLDREPEVQDDADALPLDAVHRGITYQNVRFRYDPERPALEDISFDAPVGSISAIVGPTGSGKTTLMAMLLRLFEPQQGEIQIDGTPLRRFSLEGLRSKVAVALQENLLFGTTIAENIRYAVPDASDEAVREAARVACADGFIERLDDGYDTLLGERGTKLSTGQRQRLSIARAVLKDTPILILDEPTASLDAETELRVMRNLAEWGKGRLIFLITHRLSTIR
ncbi:MAG: ABC transporter ATP-binding protein, partial [Myxococcota bacterium]|nr:ABC transporter ATP-binding protein [Myxococcota bacterium]